MSYYLRSSSLSPSGPPKIIQAKIWLVKWGHGRKSFRSAETVFGDGMDYWWLDVLAILCWTQRKLPCSLVHYITTIMKMWNWRTCFTGVQIVKKKLSKSEQAQVESNAGLNRHDIVTILEKYHSGIQCCQCSAHISFRQNQDEGVLWRCLNTIPPMLTDHWDWELAETLFPLIFKKAGSYEDVGTEEWAWITLQHELCFTGAVREIFPPYRLPSEFEDVRLCPSLLGIWEVQSPLGRSGESKTATLS